MNLKKSLLIALFSFGIVQSAFAETDSEIYDRAKQFYLQSNYAAAFPLFKQLAERGYTDAQGTLGTMYKEGYGVAQSSEQATYWHTKAFEQYKLLAEQGNAQAQFNLGGVYELGHGVARSDKQAVYWYEKAAEQGYASAQLFLGDMYANGKGVRRDISKAKQLYGQACDNGYPAGCSNYAELDKQGVR